MSTLDRGFRIGVVCLALSATIAASGGLTRLTLSSTPGGTIYLFPVAAGILLLGQVQIRDVVSQFIAAYPYTTAASWREWLRHYVVYLARWQLTTLELVALNVCAFRTGTGELLFGWPVFVLVGTALAVVGTVAFVYRAGRPVHPLVQEDREYFDRVDG